MGQYGAVIGGAVGAVVGFFAGGNVYAGWMIGSAIGGAYSASQQVIPGPKIGDISQQTSQEGVSRPIIFGRSHPIAGNIICDGGPRIVKRRERQGKGGPKVESESAYRTYAVGVCEGPIKAFLQVWKNNQLVYDAEDPAMSAENADFLRYARFYLGTYDQMPSPDLEAIKGAGNVSSHRGSAYMVLKDEDVTDQRGMWSQWTFRVSTTAIVGSPEDFQLGAEGADFGYHINEPCSVLNIDSTGRPVAIHRYSTGSWQNIHPNESWVTRTYDESFSTFFETIHTYVEGPPDSPNVNIAISGFNESGWAVGMNGNGAPYGLFLNGQFRTELVPYTGAPQDWNVAEPWYSPEYGGLVWFRGGLVYVGVRAGGSPKEDYNTVYCWAVGSSDGLPVAPIAQTARISEDDAGPRFWMHVSNQGKVRTLNTDGVFLRHSYGLTVEAVEQWPGEVSPGDVYIKGFGVDEAMDIIACCYNSGEGHIFKIFRRSTGDLIRSYQIDEGVNDEPVTRVLFSEGKIYLQRRQRFFYVNVTVVDGAMLLSEVVENICERSGLLPEMYDVTALTDQVRGFTITNQYPAYGALQSLSQAFFFDPSNVSGTTRFVKRGGPAVLTVQNQEMIEDESSQIEETRRDTLSIPRVLHLNYYDVAGGLNTDKQVSERPEEPRANGEQSLQTTVVLSADEAATVVAINHGAMAEMQKGELNFSLPDRFLRLTEADPIFVQWEGKSVRGVIAQVETDDGEQRYKVYRDRQSLYSLQVEGIPAAPVTPSPSRIVGPTLLELIDIPILRDADDRLGFYIAVSGVRPAWQGAFIEASFDGGETYEDGQRVTSPSIIGSLTQPIGDHPQEFPDYVNSTVVLVRSDDGLLSDSSLAGMMSRRNLAVIGNEIVNFSQVDEVEEGSWSVSNFLRGRKGTQTSSHAIGTRFVLLDGAIFVPADLVLLNRTITFRATTFGRPVDEATIVNFTFTGQSQRERAPAYLQAYKDGADAVISWQGVGRLGGGVNVAMGASFTGYRVTITDGATTQEFDTLAQSLTTSIAAFTGELKISVQQRNSLTGLGPAIQINMAA